MNEWDDYLRKVMKGTFLQKGEKAVWLEEMQAHLEDAVENYKGAGLSDVQARERALRSFGESKAVELLSPCFS